MQKIWFLCLISFLSTFSVYSGRAQMHDSLYVRHFEIRLGAGFSAATTGGNYKNVFGALGYTVYESHDVWSNSGDIASGSGMTLTASWYFQPRFAVGLAYASLGKRFGYGGSVKGSSWISEPAWASLELGEEHGSEGFFLTGSWIPLRSKTQFSDLTIIITGGAGMNAIDVTYHAQSYYAAPTYHSVSMKPFGMYLLASLEQQMFEHVAFGLSVEYRYIPNRVIDAFTLPLQITPYKATVPFDYNIDVPSHSINFSDWKIGLITSFYL